MEIRKGSRYGFVRYGGSRYGVPATLACCTVEVRELDNYVELRSPGSRIALHAKVALPGTEIGFVGQWDCLLRGERARKRWAIAVHIPGPEVEVRPPSAYESLVGGGGPGRSPWKELTSSLPLWS